MSVKGYLVFVPFENVASMEYGGTPTTPGSVTRPDMVTVATTPGHLAGPFEVHQTVQDDAPMAEALRSALKIEAWGDGGAGGGGREPCEDHDGSLRACCGTRQLGPHAQDCRLSASMQTAMGDHERMYSHETEVRDG
jgi:hypothetical protein